MTATYLDRWPPYVEKLKALWLQGYSASQIASILNKDAGSILFSRNACIGKLHRLGLSGRDQPARPDYRPRAPRRAKEAFAPAKASKPNFTAPPPHAAPTRAVSHHLCQWPMNDWPPGMSHTAQFCHEATEAGSSYCCAHHDKSWVKPFGKSRTNWTAKTRAA